MKTQRSQKKNKKTKKPEASIYWEKMFAEHLKKKWYPGYIKNSLTQWWKHNAIKMDKRVEWHFTKEDIQMANRGVKNTQPLLIREMKIKTTKRYYHRPTYNEKDRHHQMWVRMWQLLIKLYKHLPCDPAIPFPGVFPREMETYIHKKMYTGMFTAALFIGVEKLETCQLFLGRRMDQQMGIS